MSEQTKVKLPNMEKLLTKYPFSRAVELINNVADSELDAVVEQIWTTYHRLCLKEV